ncbi:MAG: 2-oxoglutarate dehydrogenase E1 component, partial [Chloroflexia bacterium]
IESGSIDWAHAESLAFAAILADGTPIRLTGQDTERGTFSQRHLVLHDVKSGERFIPHQSIAAARASFAVYNSPLSENAALAFEYGYSAHAPSTLVLWEAQFGDFINGAQVIVDQFIVSGQAKWRQRSGLVLLLPHGYEGQGPEHSSARLERFLQLAANDNIRVANITTSAQYYHLLRRQAASLASDPRPLVVMTPKSLLRNPKAASSIEELADVPFQSILADDRGKVIEATRLVVCSGKVYVDLVKSPQYEAAQDVVVVRVEELYPFPERELREVLETYPHIEEIVWTQEEPQNMGAWAYLSQRLGATLPQDVVLGYVGRPELASPAEGSIDLHNAEQSRIVEAALIGKPDHTVAPRREGVKHG